jgi:DNA-directed RNA polymerase specialized sigma24 family protein
VGEVGVSKIKFLIPPVPIAWLEDETLHSMAVRHVLVAGRDTIFKAAKSFFGNITGRIECHFQGHIDSFVAQTKGLLGQPEDIIHTHTIVPSYLSFMTESLAREVLEKLCGPKLYLNTTHLFREGKHPFPRQRHLRLCIECMTLDEKMRGFAHWRKAHQLPGAYRCLKHGCELHQFSVKQRAYGSVLDMPRSDPLFRERITIAIPRQDGERESAICTMAQVAVAISQLSPCIRFDPKAVNRVYRARLQELGLIVNDRLMRTEANLELIRFAGALDMLPDAPNWLSVNVLRKELIFRMLSNRALFSRPFAHAMFIAWLFGSLTNFQTSYAFHSAASGAKTKRQPGSSAHTDAGGPLEDKARRLALRKAELHRLLRSGVAHCDAAKLIGMNRVTARLWATELGFIKERVIASLPLEVREELERALRAGTTVQEIAKRLGIPVVAVDRFRYLRPDIKLERQELEQAGRAPILRAAKKSWLEALQRRSRGDTGATRLVKSDGRYFRSKDPVGYRKMMSLHPPKLRQFRELPRMAEMDGELPVAISQAASAFRAENPCQPIHTWDIVRTLESRGLLNLDCERLMLPLAHAALKLALSERPVRPS